MKNINDNSPTVIDVANYVLKKQGCMTTMKLEKLVYYCQCWSLAWDEMPLFDEDFEAWANGPVCPKLFNYHRGEFRVCSIGEGKEYKNFTNDQIETMDSVLEFYGKKTSQWLSENTHQELPWKEARRNTPLGAQCNNIISKELMQQYYGGLV